MFANRSPVLQVGDRVRIDGDLPPDCDSAVEGWGIIVEFDEADPMEVYVLVRWIDSGILTWEDYDDLERYEKIDQSENNS